MTDVDLTGYFINSNWTYQSSTGSLVIDGQSASDSDMYVLTTEWSDITDGANATKLVSNAGSSAVFFTDDLDGGRQDTVVNSINDDGNILFL